MMYAFSVPSKAQKFHFLEWKLPAAYFEHNNEWILSVIGIIISCGIVLYVIFGPTNKNIHVSYYYNKENRWSSYFRHHFEITPSCQVSYD